MLQLPGNTSLWALQLVPHSHITRTHDIRYIHIIVYAWINTYIYKIWTYMTSKCEFMYNFAYEASSFNTNYIISEMLKFWKKIFFQ
jgi:hypothetical protein